MRKRAKMPLAAFAATLLALSLAACGGGPAQSYAKETDLPEGTTLLLLTEVKYAGSKRFAVAAKAGKATDGVPEAIDEQSDTFLPAAGVVFLDCRFLRRPLGCHGSRPFPPPRPKCWTFAANTPPMRWKPFQKPSRFARA